MEARRGTHSDFPDSFSERDLQTAEVERWGEILHAAPFASLRSMSRLIAP
jgi:hypothetical protein